MIINYKLMNVFFCTRALFPDFSKGLKPFLHNFTTGIKHLLKRVQAMKTDLYISKASFGNMPDTCNIRRSVVSGLDQAG